MAEITYRIRGLRKLQNATKKAPGVIFNRQTEAMHRSVGLLEGLAVLGTPHGPGHFGFHMIDRWSTHVYTGPRRIVGVVQNSALQSRLVEFDTQPHLIPSTGHGHLKLGGQGWSTVIQHPGHKGTHMTKKALAASKGAIKVFFLTAAQGVTQSMATSGD